MAGTAEDFEEQEYQATAGSGPRTPAKAARPVFVIAGDWVVDENWFLVRHHSETSKHTGDAHYRRLESRDEQGPTATDSYDKILDLCGAGVIARVLFNQRDGASGTKQPDARDYGLRAIGRWYGPDTTYLTHLVHPPIDECIAGKPAYRLLQPDTFADPAPDIELHTLDEQSPTIRAVRLYHRRKDGWHLVNRVDWEPPKGDDDPAMDDTVVKEDKDVLGVVLDDLEKGTVNRKLVELLLSRYPCAVWFVRAKQRNPSWLELIRDRLALFVIGPEVAFKFSPFERWQEGGEVTREAMEVLDSVEADNVILLSERRDVVGKFCTAPKGREYRAMSGRSFVPATAINQVGWADAFMAGLVYEIGAGLRRSRGNTPPRVPVVEPVMIEAALRIADGYEGVTGVPNRPAARDYKIQAVPGGLWSTHADAWRQARTDKGVVTLGSGAKELHVWRSHAGLSDYIACIDEKREILHEIGTHLRAFSRGSNQRSLGILVQADPGTGKSHLARCLARAFDYEILACDISQMVHREEIFNFFDLIATTQARSDRKVLAFVDEVNATIEGMPAYGAFLSPLEGNRYARRGHEFTLKPCVWLFTGTKISDTAPEDKGSDFMSRMTLREDLDFASLSRDGGGRQSETQLRAERVEASAKLEQVYFGATMINQFFPDVTHVDQRLLERFQYYPPAGAPFREIRQLAASLRNVRHGRVDLRNLPDADETEVPAAGDDDWVRLVFQPEHP